MIGTIKMKSDEKGFGFIISEELPRGENEIFFHFSSVEGGSDAFEALQKDQQVSFEVAAWKSGKKQAMNVQGM